MACKDAKDFDGAVKLFEDCAEQYMLSGSIDTAVMTIEKAGKILENGYPQKAVEVGWTKPANAFVSLTTQL